MADIVSSGIEGLDVLLHGGLLRGSSIIVEGAPGTGKTTLGVQFLVDGIVRFRESGMYITFEELPEQIYSDMQSFGWDLRELERDNRLRVLCMSPDVLLEQASQPGGILEQLIGEIGCRRIVIDSIGFFRFTAASGQERRERMYVLRNALKKFEQTSIFIREQESLSPGEIPFEHYVADGVVRLSLQEHEGKYRKRTVEVVKMRGRKIMEGEHTYRIMDNGVHVVPAYFSMHRHDAPMLRPHVPTGVSKLDEVLGGGIPEESFFMLDSSSWIALRLIVTPILTQSWISGQKLMIFLSNDVTYKEIKELMRRNRSSVGQVIENSSTLLIDAFGRKVPEEFRSLVAEVSGDDVEQLYAQFKEKLEPLVLERQSRGEKLFFMIDFSYFAERCQHDPMYGFPKFYTLLRSWGVTLLLLCNTKEMSGEMAAYLARTARGVIATWDDGKYPYLQVRKSPNGRLSEPLIVEAVPEMPLVRLV